MKIKFHFSFLMVFFCSALTHAQDDPLRKDISRLSTTSSQNKKLPDGISDDWYQQATKKIDEKDYAFQLQKGNAYFSYNKTNNLGFTLQPAGISIKKFPGVSNTATWETSLQLTGITKGNESWNTTEFVAAVNTEKNLRFRFNHFDVEYINDKTGMRQNFIINEKPAGNENLSVELALDKKLTYSLDGSDKLYAYNDRSTNARAALIYDELKVWDANGRSLAAHMELDNNNLSLVVNDQNAVYPVTVDPLSHTPEWTTSADGILPGLLTNFQLQVDALYGFNVAGLGDVNGDGYDDVAIGAPLAIDIIAGPATVVGAGAVFVYFGSPAGLSTTPDKVLRSTTPIANALFGFSVAGGNVTGNSRNDIIIGAPGERYSTAVSGLPVTANVTAGKVYVFKGEDMSVVNPSPLLSVYLSGSVFFSNGIALTIGANVSINALFGFSVAATEDMNGDGLGEIIVGAPGYGELALLPVRSGAAFVYYSSNLATNTPVKLKAPTSSLLGIPLLTNEGLLFGFSVDGLGDYNKDGKNDVVVGAPAGVSLTLGNLLGGSAYVFAGNGAGVNTTAITQLKATPSLVNTLANLFGYAVRGVRNADGTRNGNVLVSAPTGNLLSNVLNGLRLKAGTVCVFKSKLTPASEEVPAQNIPSPRTPSLLSILAGQNLSVTALFGASLDNMLDVNCDGINDIIIGEPLSTSVGIINANVIGGTAGIYLGKADGTYNTTPYWDLANEVSYNAGVNAGSLLGYSVAGARHTRGAQQGVRSIIGAPGAALDFGSGIFNLGNTIGTLTSFVAGNNGLGKAYMFGYNNCGVIYHPDVNVTYINTPVYGSTNTNDVVPAGTTYGTPVANGTNPSGGTITMFSDGSYTFTSTTVGVFTYLVPSCLPGEAMPCTPIELKISVLNPSISTNPPVANTDIAYTEANIPVPIKSLENDKCSNLGCSLNTTSVMITSNPTHGTAVVDPVTGDIMYTPAANYFGKDTLTYSVCDNGAPAKCATAKQVITVWPTGLTNETLAADDYITTYQGAMTWGNGKMNDTDPEHHTQTVAVQTTTIPGKGTMTMYADGTYNFVPIGSFTGPVSFQYSLCDNGTSAACANGTAYIMVIPLSGPLAVAVSDFGYTQKDCSVKLTWKTTRDINLKEFVVENSVNGIDWISLGTIKAVAGNQYNFVQPNPAKGNNYYRLSMIDKQGTKTYSGVLNASVSCQTTTVIANPNPFTDKVNIFLTSDKQDQVVITLLNGAGKKVATSKANVKIGSNKLILSDLDGQPAGMYILQVSTSTQVYNMKLIK